MRWQGVCRWLVCTQDDWVHPRSVGAGVMSGANAYTPAPTNRGALRNGRRAASPYHPQMLSGATHHFLGMYRSTTSPSSFFMAAGGGCGVGCGWGGGI